MLSLENDNPLKHGAKLAAIVFPDESEMRVGQFGVTDIVVHEMNGQMAYVPWAAVYVGGKLERYVNFAHLESVVPYHAD